MLSIQSLYVNIQLDKFLDRTHKYLEKIPKLSDITLLYPLAVEYSITD
jgi:hypothetical protein